MSFFRMWPAVGTITWLAGLIGPRAWREAAAARRVAREGRRAVVVRVIAGRFVKADAMQATRGKPGRDAVPERDHQVLRGRNDAAKPGHVLVEVPVITRVERSEERRVGKEGRQR